MTNPRPIWTTLHDTTSGVGPGYSQFVTLDRTVRNPADGITLTLHVGLDVSHAPQSRLTASMWMPASGWQKVAWLYPDDPVVIDIAAHPRLADRLDGSVSALEGLARELTRRAEQVLY